MTTPEPMRTILLEGPPPLYKKSSVHLKRELKEESQKYMGYRPHYWTSGKIQKRNQIKAAEKREAEEEKAKQALVVAQAEQDSGVKVVRLDCRKKPASE